MLPPSTSAGARSAIRIEKADVPKGPWSALQMFQRECGRCRAFSSRERHVRGRVVEGWERGQLRSLVFGGKKEGAERVRTLGPWSCTGDVYSFCAPSSPSSSILALESDRASMSTHAFASNSSRRHHDLSLIRPRGNDNAVIVECFGSRMKYIWVPHRHRHHSAIECTVGG